MKYTGALYGKIGRRTIPLKMSSSDVDRLQEQRNELLEALEMMNLVIGLTPIAGNKDALQEACDIARAVIAKAKEPLP